MVRFFIDKNKIKENIAFIENEEYRHIRNVCRLREKDKIDLIDGEGKVYNCVIDKVYKNKIEAKIIKEQIIDIESKIKINLFQSVVKPAKLDLIIEKAVELGVSEITPVYSERTQYKIDDKKLNRLNKIVKTAVCQCGRSFVPVVAKTVGLKSIFSKINPKDLTLFLNEAETDKTKTIKNIIKSCRGGIYAARQDQINGINLIIGPEGGFTKKEADFLICKGAISVTLGKRILRAETAVISAIAVLMSEIEEM